VAPFWQDVDDGLVEHPQRARPIEPRRGHGWSPAHGQRLGSPLRHTINTASAADPPRVIVTDKLKSYGTAKLEMLKSDERTSMS
jgi:hypothetical protein